MHAQVITTVAGNGMVGYNGDGGQATSAKLSTPEGVASDGFGNLYISDYGNNRIRKVNSLGIITTYAGNGIGGFSGDGGPATNAELNAISHIATDITDKKKTKKLGRVFIPLSFGNTTVGLEEDGKPILL